MKMVPFPMRLPRFARNDKRELGKRLTVKFCCAISYAQQMMTKPVKEKEIILLSKMSFQSFSPENHTSIHENV